MEGATTLGWSDIQAILSPVTSQFSVQTIVAIIVGILGITTTFVFLWWGVRKAYSAIMSAVTKGKGKA